MTRQPISEARVRHFEIVRMFANGGATGSVLAVVPEARSLSTEAMLSVARKLDMPETAFVVKVSATAVAYCVRVFRPDAESPFGGHSAIGTAAVLARLGIIRPGPVVQECGLRELAVHVRPDGVAALTGTAPNECQDGDAATLRAVSGLAAEDVLEVPNREAGFGPLFHYLPVRADAVARARVDTAEMTRRGLADLMVFSWAPDRRLAHTRMFAPGYGMPEDPACAPAALGLGVWLADAGWLPVNDGALEFQIRQGAKAGQWAALACRVTLDSGQIKDAAVSGSVVSVSSGWIDLRGSALTSHRLSTSG
jgi:trans-2,3-dihydro-3-hydroxyanthranilate isomerase